MIFNFSFEDFQKMLTENNGKPVYEITTDGFVLYWTLNGFVYQTSVSLNDILKSYREQIGNPEASLEKAVGVFNETYLKDCYEHRGKIKEQVIKTVDDVSQPVRVESKIASKWAYKNVSGTDKIDPKSMWIENNPDTGNKIIKGIDSNDTVTIVGLLEKAKEEEQKLFKPKVPVVHDDSVIEDRRSTTPPDASGIKPKVEVKTESNLLGKMLPEKKVVE